MNDRNDDSFLTDTLQRAAADVQTPFDAIAAQSITAGRRLRRRRTAGVVLGSAACVAALSTGIVGVTQLLPGDRAVDPGFGTGPSGSQSPSPAESPSVDRSTVSPAPGTGDVPVSLDLAGWTCEEFPADDKMWCTGPGDRAASINWREASTHDGFVGKYPGERTSLPMLGGDGFAVRDAGILVAISEPGQRWFVSIQPTEAVTMETLHDLADHLSWQ